MVCVPGITAPLGIALKVAFDPVSIAYTESGAGDQPEAILGAANDGDIGLDSAAFVAQLRIACTTNRFVYICHCQVLQESASVGTADLELGKRGHIDENHAFARGAVLATDGNVLLWSVEAEDVLLRDITLGEPVGALPAEL